LRPLGTPQNGLVVSGHDVVSRAAPDHVVAGVSGDDARAREDGAVSDQPEFVTLDKVPFGEPDGG